MGSFWPWDRLRTASSCPGGTGRARCSYPPGVCQIEVSDEGLGVPESEQIRIWEKFFRGAGAVTSTVRGSDLGLALVKHVVTLHGGTVGVRSVPGRGATGTSRLTPA
jgi:signal transduction histidine kinase